MSVTEAERYRLYESLKASLGTPEAETFMNLMPHDDWSEFAMKTDIAELRAEMRAEFAELRASRKADLADLRSDLQRTFGSWLFTSQAAVIAAVALIVGLLR